MHWSFFLPFFCSHGSSERPGVGDKAGHPGSPLFVGLWHFEPFNKITWSKCTRRQFTVSAVAVMSFSGLQEVVLSTHPGNPHAHALGLPWCSLTGCFHCRWCANHSGLQSGGTMSLPWKLFWSPGLKFGPQAMKKQRP